MGESMPTMRYIIFFMRHGFSCLTWFPIPHNKTKFWKNRSLKEMASCMLHEKSLSQRLWDEALNCATYIQKIYPHIFFKDKTLYKAWIGLKLEVTHFCIFGSHAWARFEVSL
jgi:hypothetical protein